MTLDHPKSVAVGKYINAFTLLRTFFMGKDNCIKTKLQKLGKQQSQRND